MSESTNPGFTLATNFLLGNGHVLTSDVIVRKRIEEKPPPYTIEEARGRVAPMFAEGARVASALPAAACPGDYAVGVLTLHPQYIAKSYYPDWFLHDSGLVPLGSRSATVKPDKVKGGRSTAPSSAPMGTVDLFVAAPRRSLERLGTAIGGWEEDTHRGASDLFKVERFRVAAPSDRVRSLTTRSREPVLLDVALHNPEDVEVDVLDAFIRYAESLGAEPMREKRLDIGGLSFLPVRAAPGRVAELGLFSFLRVVRAMPPLRPLRPLARSVKPLTDKPPAFPAGGPVDPNLRVAVFDGGLPSATTIRQFATAYDADGVGPPVPAWVEHGMAVTSALLFGPIPKSGDLPQPYAHVDHYRVLDSRCAAPGTDPDLYDVLHRIRNVIQTGRYQFANLSLGPAYPIEDDDVNPWTAVLDDLLSDGSTLMTVAVGNDGDRDRASGLARVQVPSDSVNALAVGACDTREPDWRRASYSCLGPGRSPGRVKPDLVTFGGSSPEALFPVLDRTGTAVSGQHGTSFASPSALRKAVGIRAHFGAELSPLAIKALLVHCCENEEGHDRAEVGWGRLPDDLHDYVACEPGTVRIVYQGRLNPAQFLRTPIPLPSSLVKSKVTIRATFCIASVTDPQDPSNYTRGGLDVTFRPDATKMSGTHPKSDSFFRNSDFDSEPTLRRDAHKWETVVHATKTMFSTSLCDPAFDVHYQTRIGGRKARGAEAIHYALVVTLRAPKNPDLYNQVLQRYRTLLQPIRPRQTIQIRT
jgi:hypothetical protein